MFLQKKKRSTILRGYVTYLHSFFHFVSKSKNTALIFMGNLLYSLTSVPNRLEKTDANDHKLRQIYQKT